MIHTKINAIISKNPSACWKVNCLTFLGLFHSQRINIGGEREHLIAKLGKAS